MRKILMVAVMLMAAGMASAAREIVVTSTADSGTGTLRWALQTARSGDVVLFDSAVFPPGRPAVIQLTAGLPSISQGRVTVDASNAGVILDGSRAGGEWVTGIDICSNDNTIMGLQIVNFSGAGIHVNNAHRNTIGGDRTKGTGPLGQGNLTSGNADGIGLRGACDNVVAGNLIGTDVTQRKPLGNRVVGIFIQDGASRNVIGPGNVIAFNHHNGVDIRDLACFQNTITANSIHNNAGLALSLPHPVGLDAPLILDFDLQSGTVSGGTCAGCRVEIFSDEGHQGAIYEGEAHANDEGRFAFSAGRPLAGPSLTATATDHPGSTSTFSSPTQGTGVGRILQGGNSSVRQVLDGASEHSSLPAGTRMGIMFYILCEDDSPESACWTSRQVAILRANRIRLSFEPFDWHFVHDPDWHLARADMHSSSIVTACNLEAVRCLNADGVQVMYTLNFWPSSLESWQGRSRFSTEEDVEEFVDYVRLLARQLKGLVTHYEVLNEPNIHEGTPQYVALEDYIALLVRVVEVIRQEDPSARVVASGGSNLVEPRAQQWLFSLVQSDAIRLADGIAWHPMYGTSPAHEEYQAYYAGYATTVRMIRRLAEQRGFSGELLVEELTWRTPQNPHPLGHEPWIYPEQVAGKYYARGIVMHLGMDVLVGIAGEAFQTIEPIPSVFRRLSTVMAGHEAIDMPVEIHIDYDGPLAYCSFRYPNGDRILALWTDGVAQEEDPGVPAVIKFPGLTAGRVTGIDVLHGFEQELVFDTKDGSTKVRDVLVKDYPILIRLSDLTFSPDYVETLGDGFYRLGDPSVGSVSGRPDRDGDGVPDDEDLCPDWPGKPESSGC